MRVVRRPVLTVTLNAALDVTYRVDALSPHASHRVGRPLERAGGKGLNVARVLSGMGCGVVVTGFAGGATGERLRNLLAGEGEGARDALVTVAGESRRTVAVVEEGGGATLFNEPGPTVDGREWARLCGEYRRLLPECSAVALCGSLPPGVPPDAYATLVRAAHEQRLPVVVDASGGALRHALTARPEIIKPNVEELAETTGLGCPYAAARRLADGGATAVAASLGAKGLVLVAGAGGWRAEPPWELAGNPTGAGDSVVAALLSGLVEGLAWPEVLRRAVALSAATVLAPGAGEFDREAFRELLPLVRVEEGVVPASFSGARIGSRTGEEGTSCR
ncbi:1-phosphofructokinase family hexose kinase [Streptomyces sp. NPDC005438]|uniref:1-phosphofructokinase family hexose kinase n=1 Tax=Streptomyces sp. NPDC005438 TaxID=3156880 RepID=UPI0033A24584